MKKHGEKNGASQMIGQDKERKENSISGPVHERDRKSGVWPWRKKVRIGEGRSKTSPAARSNSRGGKEDAGPYCLGRGFSKRKVESFRKESQSSGSLM